MHGIIASLLYLDINRPTKHLFAEVAPKTVDSSWVVIHLSYPSITIEGGQAVGSYGIVDSGKWEEVAHGLCSKRAENCREEFTSSQLSLIKHRVGYEHVTATSLAIDYISEIIPLSGETVSTLAGGAAQRHQA